MLFLLGSSESGLWEHRARVLLYQTEGEQPRRQGSVFALQSVTSGNTVRDVGQPLRNVAVDPSLSPFVPVGDAHPTCSDS